MDDVPGDNKTNLQWTNVALGLSFVLFDSIVSHSLGLGVGRSLITAATRCIIQLAVVALILERVFATNNAFAVAGIALLLNLMGTFETVANKCKRRYQHMFFAVLAGMLISTIPTSILGVRYAMGVQPFWRPEQYIPIVGMLCGSTISGVAVSVSYVLKELDENRDKIETYLAFGASRLEACKPIATEALRLALTPTINQMSVLGIIAIPGMMTGALLGGSSVQQAAKLQMVIMFMISASTTLASIVTTVLALLVCVDREHRIRGDRIDSRVHIVWRARNWVGAKIAEGIRGIAWHCTAFLWRLFKRKGDDGDGERDRLLG
ncbi:UPF0014-domain-containing protein [Artomyces pyxidatus]|uniref:UPF0014-domain-containing protein n=1 Tax=Artomyces pyxidatus TaxID=48021 RepID=A0ACB8TFN1_9AGAM|nr:UPF0014-domain-containing protein [Artomyces pyxidatus]